MEFIHDEVVSKYWSLDQPVSRDEYRDYSLIDSAVNRPFQCYGDVEFYPGLFPKTGPLFHSLVCNHAFGNGNKRTAVISVDAFLMANGMFLALANSQMYDLANETATHNENGVPAGDLIERISGTFRDFSVPIEQLRDQRQYKEIYESYRDGRIAVRNHPTNQRNNRRPN